MKEFATITQGLVSTCILSWHHFHTASDARNLTGHSWPPSGDSAKPPNKAPEPTTFAVTSRAIEGSAEGIARTVCPMVARAAPAKVVAHL